MVLVRETVTGDWRALHNIRLEALRNAPDASEPAGLAGGYTEDPVTVELVSIYVGPRAAATVWVRRSWPA